MFFGDCKDFFTLGYKLYIFYNNAPPWAHTPSSPKFKSYSSEK